MTAVKRKEWSLIADTSKCWSQVQDADSESFWVAVVILGCNRLRTANLS